MIITILFIAFGVLLLGGVPITVSLGLSSVIAMVVSSWLGHSTAGITFLVQGMFTAFDSFPIMAVPMFMLAGEIMNRGGASRRLINLASVLVGRYQGGLAYIAIVSCMFFACISGSGPATSAAVVMLRKPFGSNLIR